MIVLLNNDLTLIINNNKKFSNNINRLQNIYISENYKIISKSVCNPLNKSIIILNGKKQKSYDIIKHSCAHLLAHALKLIYHNVKLKTGPVTNKGFFYDFYIREDKKIDLNNIESKMHAIKNLNLPIKKFYLKKCDALLLFYNNKFKYDIINKIDGKISFYRQGNFIDLCRGPHVKSTRILSNFKINGISQNRYNDKIKITRIDGIVNKYSETEIKNIAIDHRIVGQNLELFTFNKNVSGTVIWNSKGWLIFNLIRKHVNTILNKNKYSEVNTPKIVDEDLLKMSGHIEKFNEYMHKIEMHKNFILKPMNCPCHIKIFNSFEKKSYRDLPIRISEYGSCFRNEPSGSLHGLMRLRNFTQDDAHIFCTEEHISEEITRFINFTKKLYHTFGFKTFTICLAKRPKNILGDLNNWQKSENKLDKVLKKMNIHYSTSNDGAFYGPKIEISLKDNLNRVWQCGTIQLDFFTAKRLNASYTCQDGSTAYPILIHRAMLGSIERFIGVLLENNSGNIPFKLSPYQIEIIYINTNSIKYAKTIYQYLSKHFRLKLEVLNKRLNYKINKSANEKIPFTIIVGKEEILTKTISFKNKRNKFNNFSINKFKNYVKTNLK